MHNHLHLNSIQDGNTAIFVAATQSKPDHIEIVKLLLSHPDINPFIKNTEGDTIFQLITGFKLFMVIENVKDKLKRFPVEKYGKVVLCGHSGAGKSTLTKVSL